MGAPALAGAGDRPTSLRPARWHDEHDAAEPTSHGLSQRAQSAPRTQSARLCGDPIGRADGDRAPRGLGGRRPSGRRAICHQSIESALNDFFVGFVLFVLIVPGRRPPWRL